MTKTISVLPRAADCLNKGPSLPMLLTLNPAYKFVDWLTKPVAVFDTVTRTYLRVLRQGLDQ